jgi:hypothetical protein
LAERHRDQDAPLTLHAAPGTIAETVLRLVALPHTGPDAMEVGATR